MEGKSSGSFDSSPHKTLSGKHFADPHRSRLRFRIILLFGLLALLGGTLLSCIPETSCNHDCICDTNVLARQVEGGDCPDCLWITPGLAQHLTLCASGFPTCSYPGLTPSTRTPLDLCATYIVELTITPTLREPRNASCFARCDPAVPNDCRYGLSCVLSPTDPFRRRYYCYDRYICESAWEVYPPTPTNTPYIPPGNPCRCGDLLCDPACGENYDNCSADCYLPTLPVCSCGDGNCNPSCGEGVNTCPQDCTVSPPPPPPPQCSCGDGNCDAGCGENQNTCSADCYVCTCGDGKCDAACGENVGTCSADCYVCTCGDGKCDAACGEDAGTCPADCYVCLCGDGKCDAACGEDSFNCSIDCGPP